MKATIKPIASTTKEMRMGTRELPDPEREGGSAAERAAGEGVSGTAWHLSGEVSGDLHIAPTGVAAILGRRGVLFGFGAGFGIFHGIHEIIHVEIHAVAAAAAKAEAVGLIEVAVIGAVVAAQEAVFHAFYCQIEAPGLAVDGDHDQRRAHAGAAGDRRGACPQC